MIKIINNLKRRRMLKYKSINFKGAQKNRLKYRIFWELKGYNYKK